MLVTCTTFIVSLLLATNRIYKTNRRVTFECIIIAAESIRVVMILIYEFAFNHLIMMLSVFFVECLLRGVVCSNFVSKVMLINNVKERTILTFKIIYYAIVMLFIVGILILALSSSTALSCTDQEIYSWHWFILDGVDLIQSVLITISCMYLIKHMKEQMTTRDNPRLQFQNMQNVRISCNPDFINAEALTEGVLVAG